MDLSGYATHLHRQLAATAALGDDRTREIAGALAAAADPAMRLAILEAVTAAADEITAALLDAPGAPTVTVRLDGDELHIDVRTAVPDDPAPPPSDDGDSSARISLRLSEALKADIETAARRDAVSVNTWLIRTAGAAADAGARRASGPDPHRHSADAHRITGWVNS